MRRVWPLASYISNGRRWGVSELLHDLTAVFTLCATPLEFQGQARRVLKKYIKEFHAEFSYSKEFMYSTPDPEFAKHQQRHFFMNLAHQILDHGYYQVTNKDKEHFGFNRYSIFILDPKGEKDEN